AALGVVIVIALKQTDFGPMKVHEERALKTGEVLDSENKEKVDAESNLPVSDHGKVTDLIIPIAVLFIATIGMMYWTGLSDARREKSLNTIFSVAHVDKALLYGGIIGLELTFILFLRHMLKCKLTAKHLELGLVERTKSMQPGFTNLIYAGAID